MKRTWLLAASAGAVVAVIGVGAVLAQSSGQPAAGSSFLDRVAQKLGIDSPKLKQAIDDTRIEDIDAAVAAGNLTQKQADALKQRAANGPEFFGEKGFAPGMNGGHGPGRGFDFGLGMGMHDAAQKFAGFLGISVEQLRTELQAGNATLASVAESHGKSRDDVKSFIAGNVKSKLDAAVANQDLTQQRADQILSNLNSSLDQLIDSKSIGRFAGKFEFKFRSHGDRNGGAAPMPGAPPSPRSGAGFEF